MMYNQQGSHIEEPHLSLGLTKGLNAKGFRWGEATLRFRLAENNGQSLILHVEYKQPIRKSVI